MTAPRKGFIAGAAGTFASFAFLRYPAGAAEFSYKLGHDRSPGEPMGAGVAKAAEKIKQESGGRIEIQVFANNALGNDAGMLGQVRSGALELMLIPDGTLSDVVPSAAMQTVAFAFASYKQAFDALDGAVGARVRADIANAGLFPLQRVWLSGFHQVCNSAHAIASPEGFAGLKLRVPPSVVEIATVKAFGASPVPLSSAETYVAMQTKLVDGAALGLVAIQEQKFYEVQKYVTLTNHVFGASYLLANGDAWARLPKGLRDLVEGTVDAYAVRQRADVIAAETPIVAQLQSEGIRVDRVTPGPFRDAVRSAGLYAQWRDKFGPVAWHALESAVGTLV